MAAEEEPDRGVHLDPHHREHEPYVDDPIDPSSTEVKASTGDDDVPAPRGVEIYDSNPVTQAANSIPEAAKEAAATHDTRAAQPLDPEDDDPTPG